MSPFHLHTLKMNQFLLLTVILFIGFSFSSASWRDYKGYQVFRATPSDTAQLEVLQRLEEEGLCDFWTENVLNANVDILTAPGDIFGLTKLLTENGISFSIMIEDVGKLIEEQREFSEHHRQAANGTMNWENYQTLEIIYEWLEALAIVFPELVSVQDIGLSTQGKPLKAIKISTGGGAEKSVFWIDGTIHAREWISTGVVTYVINELTTKSSQYQDLLASLDFYIVPVVNPDGYAHTFSTNRMWRKTLSNHTGSSCLGVDANRNFGFAFGGPGSSNNPCDETYRGPNAYSEPEAEAVKNYASSINSTKKEAFITVHSYSQLWMTPWGYSTDLPEDYDELKDLSDLAVAELRSHYNTTYTTGSSANVLYQSSGSSRDWAKGEGGFKYVYTVELRDTGRYGFLLPPEQLIPTAIETWAGMQVVARHILQNRQ